MDTVTDISNQDSLLRMLIAHKGSFVSGEVASKKIGVTRSAIWKRIKLLRSIGYVIDSATRKGHKLVKSPDLLIPEEIWARGDFETIGRRIHHFTTVDSTNIVAKRLAVEGEPHGTLVIAERQISGKGRLGRDWTSPKGGLWFSTILRPQLLPQEAPKLTLLTSVVMVKVLRSLDIADVGIKWPNDLLVGGKKLCGILTELGAEMDAINYVVIGVGLNVNNSGFSEELKENAISLHEIRGHNFDRVNILAKAIEFFEREYNNACSEGFGDVLDQWRAMCVNIGQRVKVTGKSHSFEGKALDIDDFGALLVKRDDGKVERVLSGDVSLRSTP